MKYMCLNVRLSNQLNAPCPLSFSFLSHDPFLVLHLNIISSNINIIPSSLPFPPLPYILSICSSSYPTFIPLLYHLPICWQTSHILWPRDTIYFHHFSRFHCLVFQAQFLPIYDLLFTTSPFSFILPFLVPSHQ